MFKRFGEAVIGFRAMTEEQQITAEKKHALARATEIDEQIGLSTLLGQDPKVVQTQLAANILTKESRTKEDNDPFLNTMKSIPIANAPLRAIEKSRVHGTIASQQLTQDQTTPLPPNIKQIINTTASLYIKSMGEHSNLKTLFDRQAPGFKRTLSK